MAQEVEFYRVDEVAEILRVTSSHIYKLVKDEAFPYIKVGGSIRIPKPSFLKWQEENTVPAPAPKPSASLVGTAAE